MLRRGVILSVIFLVSADAVLATAFGSVRGVVHDPQHRPVAGARATLQASNSAYKQEADTNAEGVFEFQAVPLGQYTVTVEAQGFLKQVQTLLVVADAAHGSGVDRRKSDRDSFAGGSEPG
jgi:hypothetical protein